MQNPIVSDSSGSNDPSLASLTLGAELIASAGIINTIGLPAANDQFEATGGSSNDDTHTSLAGALEAYSKNLLAAVADPAITLVPIVSLADANLGNLAASTNIGPAHVTSAITAFDVAQVGSNHSALPIAQTLATSASGEIDVSSLQALGTPVVLTVLSDSLVTLVDTATGNIQISDLIAPQATVENISNYGTGTLSVTTAATHVASLNLEGKVAYTATDDQVGTGVLITAQNDASNITLYLKQTQTVNPASVDTIILGDGDNFVFDSHPGLVSINVGDGQNLVLLAGTGVGGAVILLRTPIVLLIRSH